MAIQLQTDHKLMLRTMIDSDVEFMRHLYDTTRYDIDRLPLSSEEKTKLLNHQFQAQHIHYQHFFADASFDIVLIEETRIGRLYVQYGSAEVRIIDIAIMPEFRNQGIGSKLVRDILDRATLDSRPVRLRVEPTNPALHLYVRLGFKKIADEQANWHLEWNPAEREQRQ